MGNTDSNSKQQYQKEFNEFATTYMKINKDKEYMTIERVISADLPIYIGICGRNKTDNPLAHQCIRIGTKNPCSLVFFNHSNDNLKYEFEDNTILEFMKKDDKILYHIKTQNHNETHTLNETIRKTFKTISLGSDELDKIHEFISSKSQASQ